MKIYIILNLSKLKKLKLSSLDSLSIAISLILLLICFILYIVFPACQGSEEDLLSADRLRFSRRYLHIDRVPNTMIGFRFFTVLLLRVLFSLAAFLTAEERVQTFFLENPYQNICSKRAWDQYSIEGPCPVCNSIGD